MDSLSSNLINYKETDTLENNLQQRQKKITKTKLIKKISLHITGRRINTQHNPANTVTLGSPVVYLPAQKFGRLQYFAQLVSKKNSLEIKHVKYISTFY
jgi:hypothetical protein